MSPVILIDLIPTKMSFPKDVTDEGIEISLRETQSLKARSSIIFTEGGIVILLSILHPLNALYPIDSTDDGLSKLTLTRYKHSLKAPFPTDFNEEGNEISFNLHPMKARKPIDFNDEGLSKVIFLKFEQSIKA